VTANTASVNGALGFLATAPDAVPLEVFAGARTRTVALIDPHPARGSISTTGGTRLVDDLLSQTWQGFASARVARTAAIAGLVVAVAR